MRRTMILVIVVGGLGGFLAAMVPGGKQKSVLAADDFVGREIPMLARRSPEEQLKNLKWLLTVPERTHRLIPDLRSKRGQDNRNWRAREQESLARISGLIRRLEEMGYRADGPAPGSVAARVVDRPPIDSPQSEPPAWPQVD